MLKAFQYPNKATIKPCSLGANLDTFLAEQEAEAVDTGAFTQVGILGAYLSVYRYPSPNFRKTDQKRLPDNYEHAHRLFYDQTFHFAAATEYFVGEGRLQWRLWCRDCEALEKEDINTLVAEYEPTPSGFYDRTYIEHRIRNLALSWAFNTDRPIIQRRVENFLSMQFGIDGGGDLLGQRIALLLLRGELSRALWEGTRDTLRRYPGKSASIVDTEAIDFHFINRCVRFHGQSEHRTRAKIVYYLADCYFNGLSLLSRWKAFQAASQLFPLDSVNTLETRLGINYALSEITPLTQSEKAVFLFELERVRFWLNDAARKFERKKQRRRCFTTSMYPHI